MKERINWVDRAKAVTVCTVVFCHLPQSQEWFYYRYLQAVTIVIFFFISGYLKRDRGSMEANWQKYWRGLVVPYFLYNLLIYPYWIAKFFMQHGAWPDWSTAMKPIVGTLLMQHAGTFAEPLDGPLWYLPAILIMHLLTDLCARTRHQHLIMTALCVVSFFLYAANKYWFFAPDLTPMGIMRNLPYYYIGYIFGQHRLFRHVAPKRDATVCVGCLAASLILFSWHLHAYFSGQHLLHIVLFYPVNIGFLFGVLYGCKALDRHHWTVVTNLSIGTLVIIGFHIVVISGINQLVAKALHLSGIPCYQWYDALPLALLIVALLYPIILIGKKYEPILLGRQVRQTTASTKA